MIEYRNVYSSITECIKLMESHCSKNEESIKSISTHLYSELTSLYRQEMLFSSGQLELKELNHLVLMCTGLKNKHILESYMELISCFACYNLLSIVNLTEIVDQIKIIMNSYEYLTVPRAFVLSSKKLVAYRSESSLSLHSGVGVKNYLYSPINMIKFIYTVISQCELTIDLQAKYISLLLKLSCIDDEMAYNAVYSTIRQFTSFILSNVSHPDTEKSFMSAIMFGKDINNIISSSPCMWLDLDFKVSPGVIFAILDVTLSDFLNIISKNKDLRVIYFEKIGSNLLSRVHKYLLHLIEKEHILDSGNNESFDNYNDDIFTEEIRLLIQFIRDLRMELKSELSQFFNTVLQLVYSDTVYFHPKLILMNMFIYLNGDSEFQILHYSDIKNITTQISSNCYHILSEDVTSTQSNNAIINSADMISLGYESLIHDRSLNDIDVEQKLLWDTLTFFLTNVRRSFALNKPEYLHEKIKTSGIDSSSNLVFTALQVVYLIENLKSLRKLVCMEHDIQHGDLFYVALSINSTLKLVFDKCSSLYTDVLDIIIECLSVCIAICNELSTDDSVYQKSFVIALCDTCLLRSYDSYETHKNQIAMLALFDILSQLPKLFLENFDKIFDTILLIQQGLSWPYSFVMNKNLDGLGMKWDYTKMIFPPQLQDKNLNVELQKNIKFFNVYQSYMFFVSSLGKLPDDEFAKAIDHMIDYLKKNLSVDDILVSDSTFFVASFVFDVFYVHLHLFLLFLKHINFFLNAFKSQEKASFASVLLANLLISAVTYHRFDRKFILLTVLTDFIEFVGILDESVLYNVILCVTIISNNEMLDDSEVVYSLLFTFFKKVFSLSLKGKVFENFIMTERIEISGNENIQKASFECLSHIFSNNLQYLAERETDSLMKESLETIKLFIMSCKDVNKCLTAINFMMTIFDYLIVNDDSNLSNYKSIYIRIIDTLAELCLDKRGEVRKSSNQSVFFVLSVHGLHFSEDEFSTILNNTIFPIMGHQLICMNYYEEISISAASSNDNFANIYEGMIVHHSRNTTSKQWKESYFSYCNHIVEILFSDQAKKHFSNDFIARSGERLLSFAANSLKLLGVSFDSHNHYSHLLFQASAWPFYQIETDQFFFKYESLPFDYDENLICEVISEYAISPKDDSDVKHITGYDIDDSEVLMDYGKDVFKFWADFITKFIFKPFVQCQEIESVKCISESEILILLSTIVKLVSYKEIIWDKEMLWTVYAFFNVCFLYQFNKTNNTYGNSVISLTNNSSKCFKIHIMIYYALKKIISSTLTKFNKLSDAQINDVIYLMSNCIALFRDLKPFMLSENDDYNSAFVKKEVDESCSIAFHVMQTITYYAPPSCDFINSDVKISVEKCIHLQLMLCANLYTHLPSGKLSPKLYEIFIKTVEDFLVSRSHHKYKTLWKVSLHSIISVTQSVFSNPGISMMDYEESLDILVTIFGKFLFMHTKSILELYEKKQNSYDNRAENVMFDINLIQFLSSCVLPTLIEFKLQCMIKYLNILKYGFTGQEEFLNELVGSKVEEFCNENYGVLFYEELSEISFDQLMMLVSMRTSDLLESKYSDLQKSILTNLCATCSNNVVTDLVNYNDSGVTKKQKDNILLKLACMLKCCNKLVKFLVTETLKSPDDGTRQFFDVQLGIIYAALTRSIKMDITTLREILSRIFAEFTPLITRINYF